MLDRDGSGNTITTCSSTTKERDFTEGVKRLEIGGHGGARETTGAGVQATASGMREEADVVAEFAGARPEGSNTNGPSEDDHSSSQECPVNPLHLHLRTVPGRGRGVFTCAFIPAGMLIEESPVLVITSEQWKRGDMQQTVLGEYGFCWSGGGQGIGLGLASLFNHSSQPNVNFIRQPSTSTIRFNSSRRIEPGEELCICYSADESELWFTPTETTLSPPSPPPPNNFPALESQDMFDLAEIAEREARARRRIQRKEEVRLAEQGKARPAESRRISGEGSRPSSRADSVSSTSTSSYPINPSLPEGRPLDMPPPLHSGPSRAVSTVPVVLCPELDWREEDWLDKEADIAWAEVVRVKGPAELEEDAEEEGTLDVWVVAVDDPKLTRLVLDFSKEQCPIDSRMRHLKRVARREHPETGEQTTLIALCATYDLDLVDLQTALSTYHPSLGLVPFRWSVPASPARSPEQLKLKSPIWPVAYAPNTQKPHDSSNWSAARKAWVLAGVHRIISVAQEAKALGELPVGTFVISPPECLWPQTGAFIPPTPYLRASATDTRISGSHPLKHAALNCIRQIATLRTQPPFSEMQPTRNGADYLLTSLTLFITHEPCVMCCMALLHSRIREVIYVFPRKRGGGFESAVGVHGRKDLNHRFEAWRYAGQEGEVETWLEELDIREDIAL